MLKSIVQNKFKQDLKRIKKRGLNILNLKFVMAELAVENILHVKYRDHMLTGNYKGCRECHIEPDWLLIYSIDNSDKTILFVRTGTHSDLFKK